MATDPVIIGGRVYEDFPILESDDALCTVEVVCGSDLSQVTFPTVNLKVLIDVSRSMKNSIPKIKATLNSLSHALREWENRNIILTLITFNSGASIIFSGRFSSDDDITRFEEAVATIHASGHTNISAALTLASEKRDTGSFNSLILLSDGNPTQGITDLEDLIEHRETLFTQTDVVTIGYGTDYNPQLLARLGRFTYASGCDEIPGIIGSYIGQVMTTFGVNATLSIELPHENPREVIGSVEVGNLFIDRVYHYGIAIPDDSLEDAIGKTITLTYDMFNADGSTYQVIISSVFNDAREDDIPDKVTELYYESSAGRLIDSFKQLNRRGKCTVSNCNFIRQRVRLWDENLGKHARRRVLVAIGDIPSSRDHSYREATISSSSSCQMGYNRDTDFQTPQQRRSSTKSKNIYTTITFQSDLMDTSSSAPEDQDSSSPLPSDILTGF